MGRPGLADKADGGSTTWSSVTNSSSSSTTSSGQNPSENFVWGVPFNPNENALPPFTYLNAGRIHCKNEAHNGQRYRVTRTVLWISWKVSAIVCLPANLSSLVVSAFFTAVTYPFVKVISRKSPDQRNWFADRTVGSFVQVKISFIDLFRL